MSSNVFQHGRPCVPICQSQAAAVSTLAPWRPCDVTPRATIAVQPTLPKL